MIHQMNSAPHKFQHSPDLNCRQAVITEFSSIHDFVGQFLPFPEHLINEFLQGW